MRKWLFILGGLLILLGLLWPVLDRIGFGRLPGDILIEREGFTLYVPITSMLLVSAVISLILWILNR